MIHWIDAVNYAAASAGLGIALLGLLFSLTTPYLDRWKQSWFVTTFSLILAYVASDLVEQTSALLLGTGYAWLTQLGLFWESLLSSLLMPMLTNYLLHSVGKNWQSSVLPRIVCVLWAIYAALLVVTQFTTFIYYFTPDNVYHRGPLYPLLLVPPVLLMGCNLVALWRWRTRLTPLQKRALATFILIPLACMLVQMATYGLLTIVIGTSVAALAMFTFVLTDQVNVHVREQEEASRRQAQVMALQMRPHFIYNVMTSIYYLCAQDPARAQQVTLDFTDYLRANFAAVAREGAVPFSEELGHARAYLAVEAARFEDQLEVEIDCPQTAFHLPPLTLQPLVENAVKHGVDPELPPLLVRVSTRSDGDASVVTVEDTGPGFDMSEVHADPASALANISERLAACGATLSIAPREGGGTVATIRVPAA